MKKLTAILLTMALLITNFVFVFADETVDNGVVSCGIYSGDKAITKFTDGEIYGKAVTAEGGAIALLLLYKNGQLIDAVMGSSEGKDIKTPALEVENVSSEMTLKLCVITDIAKPLAEIRMYTGLDEGEVDTSSFASFDDSMYFRIMSKVNGKFICESNGEIIYEEYKNADRYFWKIASNGDGSVTLQNKATRHFICGSDDGMFLSPTEPDADGLTDWYITELNENEYSIKNVVNKRYVAANDMSGYPKCSISKEPFRTTEWTAHWEILDSKIIVTSSSKEFKDYDISKLDESKISILSPEYRADVDADTKIKFYAPKSSYVRIACYTMNDKYEDLTVVPVNSDGFGMFDFDGTKFPFGPLNITLYSHYGKNINDICQLQVYNTAGQEIKHGFAMADPVPQEVLDLGLTSQFEDDFDEMPIVCSPHKSGKINYYEPTPNRLFSDWDCAMFSTDGKGFSQRDSYLKITAKIDAKKTGKGYTGYISSIDEKSFTGFAIKAPAYFECKFIAQNVQGAWPSFWVLNNGEHKSAEKGIELDVIEAYGSQPDKDGKFINESDTYSATSHAWYMNPPGSSHKWVEMKDVGNGALWHQAEHTYGCLVTETDTTYYLDGNAVFTHPNFDGEDEYLFFIINYAFGSGWTCDATRYNDFSDMYVDWVRVYGLEKNVMPE